MSNQNRWYNEGIENLVDEDGIKKLLPNKKKSKYSVSIPLSDLESKQKEGWNLVKTRKTTATIEKEKVEFEKFQDLVWVMLAEMGFSYLTKDSNKFKLPRGVEKDKQIDVFGIDKEDVVVLAECKAANSEGTKRIDLDSYITDICDYRPNVTQYLNKFFSPKPKYIFLLCTSNYIIGNSDKERMKKENIVWMDRSRIEYFLDLTSQLGPLAKYQFLGEILEGKSIPALKDYKVPAIKAKMGDQICYSMMLNPSTLLKLGFVLHRTDDNSRRGTYQRYVKKQRLASVNDYIVNQGGFFPNSIIVNFDRELSFQPGPSSIPSSDKVKVGTLTLPDQYKSAFIIDGQHRLYGYAGTKQKDTEVLPVIAFSKLPPEKQTNMFVDINTKAKAVKRNLIESLNGELYWNSKNPKYALFALNSMLALELNDNQDSPLFNMLEVGDNSTNINKEKKEITLTYFIDNAIKREKFFVIDFSKNGNPCSFGPFYDGDLANNSLSKAFNVLRYYYNEIKTKCRLQWEVLSTNLGVSTLSWMLCEFLLEKRNKNPDIYNNTTYKDVIRLISDRVDLFCTELLKKDPSEVQSYIKGKFGYGAVEKARRHFERFMHEADNSFTQDGLDMWIVEQSGLYTEQTKKSIDKLSSEIVSFVEDTLIEAYGENYYFDAKIPDKISSKIFDRRRKNSQATRYIELEDIRDIILTSWTENHFDDYFSNPQIKGKKEEKTQWLNKLVEIRNKIDKEEKLTESDFQIVQYTANWFLPSIEKIKTNQE